MRAPLIILCQFLIACSGEVVADLPLLDADDVQDIDDNDGGTDLSDAKAFVTFGLLAPSVSGTIDEGAKAVTINVPYGTSVTSLVATFDMTGVSVTVGGTEQVSGVTANDFTSPVLYTVIAEDTSFVTYAVEVAIAPEEPLPAQQKSLTSFALVHPPVPTIIDEQNKRIEVTVPASVDVSALVAVFSTTGVSVAVNGANQESGITVNDFSAAVTYTVTAEDSSSQDYVVVVYQWPARPIAVARTGLATSFDADTKPADDGALRRGVTWPSPRFSSGTGTEADCVVDHLTGLMWPKREVIPANTWEFAFARIDNFHNHPTNPQPPDGEDNTLLCGHNDWRLPNLQELLSLIDYRFSGSTPHCALPQDHLFITTAGEIGRVLCSSTDTVHYWTSTTATNGEAYCVSLGTGHVMTCAKDTSRHGWAVRGVSNFIGVAKTGQTTSYRAGDDGDLKMGVAWPEPRFSIAADGITDELTGLIWGPNANVMPTRDFGWDEDGSHDGAVTWQHALAYVAELNAENYLGHGDWRLPNVKEFQTLLDAENGGSNLLSDFANVQTQYWTATTWPITSAFAYRYTPYFGLTPSGSNKIAEVFVWPVRGGE